MALSWGSFISEGFEADFELNVMPPEEEDQYQFQAPSMDRSLGSDSSMESRLSAGTYQDQNDASSPPSSYGSPSEGGLTRHGSQYDTSQYLSLETAALSRESSAGLPLFNIEKDGDPNILWWMYYDFVVTKAEAYYQLRPGYLPTDNYPTRIESEKATGNGEKRHACHWPECKAKPFTRHYDLERHFVTIHQANKEQGEKVQVYCDYAKCPHKEPFRKDHCREHYREYHAEDLIKRGQPKHSKPKRGQKRHETIQDFLAARLDNLKLAWWRCSKCVQRVKVNDNGYICPGCKAACEPERVVWRENARNSGNNKQAVDSTTGYSSAPSSYVTGCGQCENAWLPDEKDPKLWLSCPQCQPGVQKSMRY